MISIKVKRLEHRSVIEYSFLSELRDAFGSYKVGKIYQLSAKKRINNKEELLSYMHNFAFCPHAPDHFCCDDCDGWMLPETDDHGNCVECDALYKSCLIVWEG